jgi:hypothetical protein
MKKNIFLSVIISTAFCMAAYTYQIGNDNKLTDTEKKEGWKLLFDGKTKSGWRAYQNKGGDSWSVTDGTLHSKGSSANYGEISGDLMSNNQFENFELSIDYKISPKGNSGILYMVKEDSLPSYASGPEYQIIDDKNFPEKLEDWQKTAADYAMYVAPTADPNAAGEWNHARIVVNKNHVEHWLNGKKVVDYELYSDDWKNKKATGKWKDYPGYGLNKKGHLVLQNHGSEAWFKNIKIKELK